MREPIHHFFMFQLRDYYFSALAPRSQPGHSALELSTKLREVSQLRHYAKQMLTQSK